LSERLGPLICPSAFPAPSKGWHLKPSAIALFENEYQLPLIDPMIAAYV